MHISFGGSILFWLLDCPSGFIKWRYLSSLKKETLRSLVRMYTYSPLKEKWRKTLSQSSSLALQLEFHHSVEEVTSSSVTHNWTSRGNSRDLSLSTKWILHVLRHIFLGRLMPPLFEVCAGRYWSLGPSTFQDDNYLVLSIVLKVMNLSAVPSPSASPAESINEEASIVYMKRRICWLC